MDILTTYTSQATIPIVTDGSTLAIGQICYFQTGTFGSALGLLLTLTKTPLFIKMIKTTNGLQKVS